LDYEIAAGMAPDALTADGVFSGGGIKGLAFAGALAAAEEFGYRRWHELAGTSAGAIAAMALAVGYDAKRMRDALDRFDFSRLADFGSPLHLIGAARNLIFHEGVVEGDALTAFIRGLLDDAGVEGVHAGMTFGDLQCLEPKRTLLVIGADIAHSRMVEFPTDVALYRDAAGRALEPEAFPIYKAVRVSAGFPYFFPPVGELRDASTHKQGVLVDGGVVSAFPLFVFDKPEPQHPTWGFHLHSGFDVAEKRPSYRDIGGLEWPKEMLAGILDTAMNARDKFELRRFGSRVIAIPTGAVSTLNFNLTKEDKEYLYDSGFKAATQFFAAGRPSENSYGKVSAPARAAAGS
jgi:NTE family protein